MMGPLVTDPVQEAHGTQDLEGDRHHHEDGDVGSHEQQQALGHDTSP